MLNITVSVVFSSVVFNIVVLLSKPSKLAIFRVVISNRFIGTVVVGVVVSEIGISLMVWEILGDESVVVELVDVIKAQNVLATLQSFAKSFTSRLDKNVVMGSIGVVPDVIDFTVVEVVGLRVVVVVGLRVVVVRQSF
jgi:hypothetical protein